MEKMQHKPSRNTLTLLGVVGVVFLILKLAGLVCWSWWFVLLPFYLPYLVLFVLCAVMGLVCLLFG